MAVHDGGEVEILVVLALRAVDAFGGVLAVGVGSSHVVNELVPHPLPRQVPLVETAEGVVVVDRDLGKVFILVRLKNVVREVEIAVLAWEELGLCYFYFEFWVFFATHVHVTTCTKSFTTPG